MPSVWIEKRKALSGAFRYRVRYRLGGRETKPRYAGMFSTKREAQIRRDWIAGRLAAMEVPDISLTREPPKGKAVAAAIEEWRDSRVDVTDTTRRLHRIALNRVIPVLGTVPINELTAADVA